MTNRYGFDESTRGHVYATATGLPPQRPPQRSRDLESTHMPNHPNQPHMHPSQVQLKPLRWATPAAPALATIASGSELEGAPPPTSMPPPAPPAAPPAVEELLLVLKWGGVLTHAGRTQAEDLGRYFRAAMYPR